MKMHVPGISRRAFGDLFLFAFTSVELALLIVLTPTFAIVDWICISGHLLVLWIALTRRPPDVQDLWFPLSILKFRCSFASAAI